jgi:alpha-ketoglutarate-dependent taurine dioxygenase
MRHAWNTLPPREQAEARRLRAVHSLAYSRALANPALTGSEHVSAELPPVCRSAIGPPQQARARPRTDPGAIYGVNEPPQVVHPVVRRTAGGETLFLGAHASHLDGEPGRDLAASRATIARLNAYICRVRRASAPLCMSGLRASAQVWGPWERRGRAGGRCPTRWCSRTLGTPASPCWRNAHIRVGCILALCTQKRAWRRMPGDVVIYDNRCVLHRGRPWRDADTTPRRLVRVTVAGMSAAAAARRASCSPLDF